MNTTKLISRAPANSMILGEHSVVYGHPAIACGLDQWLEIHWTKLSQPRIEIQSNLACFKTSLDALAIHPELTFIGHALQAFARELQTDTYGWKLEVKSEFSSTIGLGSSAAVLSATLVGLNHICQTDYSLKQLWQIGKESILKIQGRGSATDLAASLYGGLVYFQPPSENKTLEITSLTSDLQLLLVYSGYKTPTAEVLEMVANHWQEKSNKLQRLYTAMGSITQHAYQALQDHRMSVFYLCVSEYQNLMRQLGVSDDTLEHLIDLLNHCPVMKAAKISGSGLGDCVLGIGENAQKNSKNSLLEDCPVQAELGKFLQLQLPISQQGAHILIKDTL